MHRKHPYEPAWQTVHKHLCWQQHTPHNTCVLRAVPDLYFIGQRCGGVVQLQGACTHKLRRRGSGLGGCTGHKSPAPHTEPAPVSSKCSTPHSQHAALAHHQRVVVGSLAHLLVPAQEGEKQQPRATACACLCTPAKESRQPPPPPPPVTMKWQHATLCAIATPSRNAGTAPICATSPSSPESSKGTQPEQAHLPTP
jgi:hypothetical protein